MIDRTITALSMATLATPAFAHPGTHEDVPAAAFLDHIVGSPFHVLGLGAVLGIAGVVVHRLVRGGEKRRGSL
jgi:hypothetical protein